MKLLAEMGDGGQKVKRKSETNYYDMIESLIIT